MYAWKLDKPEQPKKDEYGKKEEKVGANFGVPHRDITFKNCHSPEDGSPDILSLWIPIVDVDTEICWKISPVDLQVGQLEPLNQSNQDIKCTDGGEESRCLILSRSTSQDV